MKTLILSGALFLAGCTLPPRFGSPAYYDQLYGHYVAYCETRHLGTADEPCYKWASQVLDAARIAGQAYNEQRRRDSNQQILDALDEQNFLLMHQNSVNASRPQNLPPPNLVDPLPQHGSGMSFMCRNTLNNGDSGAARIFC